MLLTGGFSAGFFLGQEPWQCLCFFELHSNVQRPKDLVLPTHRARNLTPVDWHKEKTFLWGSMAQWIAHWTSRLPGEAIQRLWFESHQSRDFWLLLILILHSVVGSSPTRVVTFSILLSMLGQQTQRLVGHPDSVVKTLF